MRVAWPAMASSTELSTTSHTRWCSPVGPVLPMYMPGRLRHGVEPLEDLDVLGPVGSSTCAMARPLRRADVEAPSPGPSRTGRQAERKDHSLPAPCDSSVDPSRQRRRDAPGGPGAIPPPRPLTAALPVAAGGAHEQLEGRDHPRAQLAPMRATRSASNHRSCVAQLGSSTATTSVVPRSALGRVRAPTPSPTSSDQRSKTAGSVDARPTPSLRAMRSSDAPTGAGSPAPAPSGVGSGRHGIRQHPSRLRRRRGPGRRRRRCARRPRARRARGPAAPRGSGPRPVGGQRLAWAAGWASRAWPAIRIELGEHVVEQKHRETSPRSRPVTTAWVARRKRQRSERCSPWRGVRAGRG
jgi:hypothetical protein